MRNMKIYLALIFIGIVSLTNIKAENPPFELQRLSTDYNGIVANGNFWIVYGNNGIITYSDDLGESWKQFCLGEFNHIKKMLSIDGKFYALTPNSIFIGTSDCRLWTEKKLTDESQFFDFTFVDGYFYITAKNKIYKIEKGLATQLEIFLEFDQFTRLSEIVSLSNFLFVIESDYYIFKINRETKQIDTIDVHPQHGSFTNRDLTNLKVINSNLYILLKYSMISQPEFAFENIRHKLIVSKDLGESWESVTDNIRVSVEYLIDDGKVYFLAPKIINFYERIKSWNVGYYQTNDNNELVEINAADTIDRWIPFIMGSGNLNAFGISKLNKINDNLLLAVGPSKTILKSKNGGLNWELVSYCKPLANSIDIIWSINTLSFLGSDSLIISTAKEPYLFCLPTEVQRSSQFFQRRIFDMLQFIHYHSSNSTIIRSQF